MEEPEDRFGSELMKELKESFLGGGHTTNEWRDLTERPRVPDWAWWWISVDDPDQAKKLQVALGIHGIPRSLLEIEVRDDEGKTTGRAVVGIREVRTISGYFTAKVTHVASTDEHFADWAQLHFNEMLDFDLHFCKKVAHTCTLRSRAKSIGWFHVSCFRLVSMLTAVNHEYMAEGAIQYFSEPLQIYMEEKSQEKARKAARAAAQEKKEKKENPRAKGRVGSQSDEETKKKRGADKKEDLVAPGFSEEDIRGIGRSPSREKAPKGPRGSRPGGDKEETSKLARESAEQPARALGRQGPQLVDRVKLTARRDDAPGVGHREAPPGGRGYGDAAHGKVHSFLDDITEGSVDGFHLVGGRDERSQRGRSRSRRRDGRGAPDKGDKKKKKDGKSSDKSDSPGRRGSHLRGRNVIAPGKETKKVPKRDKGDPSSDPNDSGSGGGKKGKKKRKRSSSSSSAGKKKDDRKKKRKKEKKKRKSKESTSSSSADSKEDLYGKETAKYESLVEKSKRNPGRLLRSGLEQMSKYLAARTGGEGGPTVSWRDQRVGAYLNQVLFNQHPPSAIGVRNTRELVTLAEAIDLLMEERLPSLGDLLMQRLKAVEASLTEGWGVAAFQELIPPSRATLTTDQERAFAARHALQQRRLSDAVKKKSG